MNEHECNFRELSESEKEMLLDDIKYYAGSYKGGEWDYINSYTTLADAELDIAQELIVYVNETNNTHPAGLCEKTQLAMAGARKGYLIDLAQHCKRNGYSCPFVPYPSVQYIVSSIYQLTA